MILVETRYQELKQKLSVNGKLTASEWDFYSRHMKKYHPEEYEERRQTFRVKYAKEKARKLLSIEDLQKLIDEKRENHE